MRIFLLIFTLLTLSCKNSKEEKPIQKINEVSNKTSSRNNKSEKKTSDSDYSCENNNFISTLEEIPNTETNAYKITIHSKTTNDSIVKLLDTRPKMSRISYCNELYTVVGFSCGGPCYSRVFIFTEKNRENEQYSYTQTIKNNPNIIAHIKDENFDRLIIHNFLNNKELAVNISNSNPWNYGQMDSIIEKKENLMLYYQSKKGKQIIKKVNLKNLL